MDEKNQKPLPVGYWIKGQPENQGGDEDCVSMYCKTRDRYLVEIDNNKEWK